MIEQVCDWDDCAKEWGVKVVHEYRAGRGVVRCVVRYVRRPVAVVRGISSDTLTCAGKLYRERMHMNKQYRCIEEKKGNSSV